MKRRPCNSRSSHLVAGPDKALFKRLCASAFAAATLSFALLFIGSVFGKAEAEEPRAELFTDYTRTALLPEYDTEEELAEFSHAADNAEKYRDEIARATDIIEGEVSYSSEREFTTDGSRGKKLDAFGDLSYYSYNTLLCMYRLSDLQLTGIYGKTGDAVTVYVEADAGARLPNVVMTQAHGYYYGGWRVTKSLHTGVNTFVWPDIVASNSKLTGEVKGGALYFDYPYAEDPARNVSVYIEGGGLYPTYSLGDDESEYLSRLAEFESLRSADGTIPDITDLAPNNALFSVPASVAYDEYIEKASITPSENLALWSDYFKKTFEFNGIVTDPEEKGYDERNLHVRVNLRYMTAIPSSGAYATDYHIGIYTQNDWLCNYRRGKLMGQKEVFDIGHEIGHVLDVRGRTVAETTNNVNAANAFLNIVGKGATEKFQPFERTYTSLMSDYSIDYRTYDIGKVLYDGATGYDHNYLVWYCLESAFPGYWGKLNNKYRNYEPYNGMNDAERVVYYSSLVTGLDLGGYFERWGFYLGSGVKFKKSSASAPYTSLMNAAKESGAVEDGFTKFYYADAVEHLYVTNHSGDSGEFDGGVPTITGVTLSGGRRTVTVISDKDSRHLGYEILSSEDGVTYKTAGFTYSNTFKDPNTYNAAPYYKAVEVNRFFKTGPESEPKKDGGEVAGGVCRVGKNFYFSLDEGIAAAKANASSGLDNTVYLLSDCTLSGISSYGELNIEVDPEIVGDITIENQNANLYMFQTGGGHLSIKGSENARIIIDGLNISRFNPMFYCSGGKFSASNVTFANCVSGNLGGVIYSINADITLSHCEFSNCVTSGSATAVVMNSSEKTLVIDSCEFERNADIHFSKSTFNLVFKGGIPAAEISFDSEIPVKALTEGFVPCDSDLENLTFTNPAYTASLADGGVEMGVYSVTVTFTADGIIAKRMVGGKTIKLGDENLHEFGNRYPVSYTDAATGKTYQRGETVTLSGDAEFTLTLADKPSVTLRFDGRTETVYYTDDPAVYLPLSDGNRMLLGWKKGTALLPAGKNTCAAHGDVFTAVYVGRFTYEFFVEGRSILFGYGNYGDSVRAPECDIEDFVGWSVGGKMYTDNLPLKSDLNAIAVTKSAGVDLAEATAEIESCVYNGRPQTPSFTVTVGGEVIPREYYTFEFSNNTSAGAARLVIYGVEGLSFGQKEFTFEISRASISDRPDPEISVENSVVFLENVALPAGWHWKDNMPLPVGKTTAVAVYSDSDNYLDPEATVTVIRAPRDIALAAFSAPEFVYYVGEPACPEVTVTDGGRTLKEEIDYIVEYSSNNSVGTAYIKITGVGDYCGEKIIAFEIRAEVIPDTSDSESTGSESADSESSSESAGSESSSSESTGGSTGSAGGNVSVGCGGCGGMTGAGTTATIAAMSILLALKKRRQI